VGLADRQEAAEGRERRREGREGHQEVILDKLRVELSSERPAAPCSCITPHRL
jgi:hypothetical protein